MDIQCFWPEGIIRPIAAVRGCSARVNSKLVGNCVMAYDGVVSSQQGNIDIEAVEGRTGLLKAKRKLGGRVRFRWLVVLGTIERRGGSVCLLALEKAV